MHSQVFPNFVGGRATLDGPQFADSYFVQGNYFPADGLVDAIKCFSERLAANATCVASVYRSPGRAEGGIGAGNSGEVHGWT